MSWLSYHSGNHACHGDQVGDRLCLSRLRYATPVLSPQRAARQKRGIDNTEQKCYPKHN